MDNQHLSEPENEPAADTALPPEPFPAAPLRPQSMEDTARGRLYLQRFTPNGWY